MDEKPNKKGPFRWGKDLRGWRARQDSNLWPSAPEEVNHPGLVRCSSGRPGTAGFAGIHHLTILRHTYGAEGLPAAVRETAAVRWRGLDSLNKRDLVVESSFASAFRVSFGLSCLRSAATRRAGVRARVGRPPGRTSRRLRVGAWSIPRRGWPTTRGRERAPACGDTPERRRGPSR